MSDDTGAEKDKGPPSGDISSARHFPSLLAKAPGPVAPARQPDPARSRIVCSESPDFPQEKR